MEHPEMRTGDILMVSLEYGGIPCVCLGVLFYHVTSATH